MVVLWMVRTESYEESELDNYIINTRVLKPERVRELASKLTTNETILDKFYEFAVQDNRMGLFKLTSEF